MLRFIEKAVPGGLEEKSRLATWSSGKNIVQRDSHCDHVAKTIGCEHEYIRIDVWMRVRLKDSGVAR